jgi:hypothetical protein
VRATPGREATAFAITAVVPNRTQHLRSDAKTEDVVQDAYLNAGALGTFREDAKPSTGWCDRAERGAETAAAGRRTS